MRFVFWEYELSQTQMAFIRALADLPYHHVTVVTANILGADRVALGWEVPDVGKITVVNAPNLSQIEDLVRSDISETTHIFYGMKYPFVREGFQAASRAECFMGVMSEGSTLYPHYRTIPLWIRDNIRSMTVAKRLSFYLAMGTWAVEWFASTGYPRPILYPFGYVVEKPALSVGPEDAASISESSDAFQIVYIGQGILRKGLDILFQALTRLKNREWQLHLVGNIGEDYRKLCQDLQIIPQVKFHGVLQNSTARKLLNCADLLVLPSRHDGWGAVVNEALMHGVPAICSSRCGAKDLLQDVWRGSVFPVNNVSALAEQLEARIINGKLSPAERVRIIEWSECITGQSAAQYFLQVMGHVTGANKERPHLPWMNVI